MASLRRQLQRHESRRTSAPRVSPADLRGSALAGVLATALLAACSASDGKQEQHSVAADCKPTPEVCDAIDNDCDGIADDNLAACGVCDTHLMLPVQTHYKAGVGPTPFASDQAEVYIRRDKAAPFDATCNPVYQDNQGFSRFPDLDQYIADTWSDMAIVDGEGTDSQPGATRFFREMCDRTGMPFRLIAANRTAEVTSGNAGAVQVIHSVQIAGALATIVLPANWTKQTPAGGYPILANGYYDINAAVFREEGHHLLPVIADSTKDGGTGAIGVFFNGGGAVAGRTLNDRAQDQFAAVIAHVAKEYGGDPQRIVMYGVSRGAATALYMASNPKRHPYRVTFVAGAVPPTLIGEHADFQSTTFPGLYSGAAWTIGFQDVWKANWRYPTCGGRAHLIGKTAAEVHRYILTGTFDRDQANNEHSLQSTKYLEGIKAAGTKVHLQVGSHDDLVPYAHQVEYGVKLFAAGVPIEAVVMIRAGHFQRNTIGVARAALDVYTRPERKGQEPSASGGIQYLRVNRNSPNVDKFEAFTPADNLFPFTLDAPRFALRNTPFPLVFVGQPDTQYELRISNAAAEVLISGKIPASFKDVQWVNVPANQERGNYQYALRIKKPNQANWQQIDSNSTPDGTPAIVTVADESDAPNYGWDTVGNFGWDVIGSTTNGKIWPHHGTGWGLSEY